MPTRPIVLATILLVVLVPAGLLSCANHGSRPSDNATDDDNGDDAGDDDAGDDDSVPYPIVDTGQTKCYGSSGEITCPQPGEAFDGQDSQVQGNPPAYQDNDDGTVSDLVTGLMWVQARGEKATWADALVGAPACDIGGYSDWRMPTIKELYSLIEFTGKSGQQAADSVPYLDANFFGFAYGDTGSGERLIDCQDWSATEYVGTTMMGDATTFGVNFADGRIKGYGRTDPRTHADKTLYARYVRGNPAYGINDFLDQGDGTVDDRATGLQWQQADGGTTVDWENALAYCGGLSLAGFGDWRLPNAKELQSIVDYTRAPLVTGTAAIDPVFQVTEIESYYWTSTTHREGPGGLEGSAAVYIAFGRAMGWMEVPPGSGNWQLLDVHGAGAQRSDPKTGNPADYPHGLGPQGDDIRIFNYVRCVRGGLPASS